MQMVFTATGCTGIISVTVNDSHTAQTSVATIETIETSLELGDYVEITQGYSSGASRTFSGYVKNVEQHEPKMTYNITCSNVLIRAMDFFIASSNPDNPFTRNRVKAETLVRDLMALAGLTNYDGENTSFTFGINNPVEVNLTSVYDYSRFIGDILAYNVYADLNGVVHFRRRLPYIVGGDSSIGTISYLDCLGFHYSKTDKNLRNRVVVYGAAGVTGEASESSPYLPSGFYKSVVVAAPTLFDNRGMAQQAAEYNLELLNRLTQSIQLSIPGNPLFMPREVLTITDSGGLDGDWYIFAATHTSDSSGYITSLELRR